MELATVSNTWLSPNNSLELFQKEILEGPRVSYTLQLKIYDIFLPVIAGAIIILNLLVLLSSGLILHMRQQPRSTYIFLGNIALADMLTGAATVFGQYYPKETRSEVTCSLQIGLIVSSTLASIYSILLIAIDRYLYILHGLTYKQYLATRRARFMALGTWLLGGTIGFLPAFGIRNSTNSGQFCWLIILEPVPLILTTTVIGVIPLGIIFALYSIILRRALGKIYEQRVSTLPSAKLTTGLRYFRGESNKQVDKSHPQTVNHTDCTEDTMNTELKLARSKFCCCRRARTIKISSSYSPSRWKAIKIVMLTTGCFFVTWIPYFLACALYATCDKETQVPSYCNNLRLAIASPLAILGLSNSLMNPFIYAWWHNGFRTSVKKLCSDVCLRRSKALLNCKNRCSSDTANTTSTSKISNVSGEHKSWQL